MEATPSVAGGLTGGVVVRVAISGSSSVAIWLDRRRHREHLGGWIIRHGLRDGLRQEASEVVNEEKVTSMSACSF